MQHSVFIIINHQLKFQPTSKQTKAWLTGSAHGNKTMLVGIQNCSRAYAATTCIMYSHASNTNNSIVMVWQHHLSTMNKINLTSLNAHAITNIN
jgi:hypothetical protein